MVQNVLPIVAISGRTEPMVLCHIAFDTEHVTIIILFTYVRICEETQQERLCAPQHASEYMINDGAKWAVEGFIRSFLFSLTMIFLQVSVQILHATHRFVAFRLNNNYIIKTKFRIF